MIIEPEFSEAAYQSLIESIFLSDFRNDTQFDIDFYSGVDERSRGYDIEVGTYIPIFLQLKTSYYKRWPFREELQIRRERFGYRDKNGAYFFKLHVDDKTKDYLQHNLLCKLCREGSFARYIAPLFLSKKLLKGLKYQIPTIAWQQSYEYRLFDGETYHEWQNYFSLMHSILIMPHRDATKVPNEHHKYFFNRRGEISFHSELERIDNKRPVFLRDFIREINGAVTNQQSERFDIKRLVQFIVHAIADVTKDNMEQELSILQTIAENDVREYSSEIRSFQGLESTFENFRLLCRYLDVRHGVKTMLVSDHGTFQSDYL